MAQIRQHSAQAELESLRYRISQLEKENRELQHQLDELRRGVGITVMIQGRPIALPPLPHMPTPRPPYSPASEPFPTAPRQPAIRGTQAPSHPAPASQPFPTAPQRAARSATLTGGPRSVPFPEDSWLTGQMRAVRQRPQQMPQQAPEQSRLERPSQRVTPGWLREDVPPAGSTGASQSAAPAGLPVMPPNPDLWAVHLPEPPVSRPHAQLRQRARLGGPRLEPAHYPTLAEITGRVPVVRKPTAGQPEERNPFTDSYVLS